MVDNGGRTALHWACTSAQVDIVKDLLEMNAQVNIKDNCGWTPLHSAASVGHDEIILLLLDKGWLQQFYSIKMNISGANVNARTDNGQVPMHYVASKNHTRKKKFQKNFLTTMYRNEACTPNFRP